jgi:hypothetical protein
MAATVSAPVAPAGPGSRHAISSPQPQVTFEEGAFEAETCAVCAVRPAAIRIRVVTPNELGFEIAQKTGLEPPAAVACYAFCAEHQASADALFHELTRR